jgi:hypothetical protein
MLESLADWFFRNLKSISFALPHLALLLPIVIALLRSLPAALHSIDWSFALDFTYAHGGHSEHSSIPSLLSQLAKAIYEKLLSPVIRNYVSAHRRKVIVSIVIVVIVIGGAQAALSRSDNEQKVRTTALAFPPPWCARSGNTQLLIFIHGWSGDPSGTWKGFPDLACADPNLSKVDVVAINYPTFMNRRNLNIEGLAKWVNGEINRIDEKQEAQEDCNRGPQHGRAHRTVYGDRSQARRPAERWTAGGDRHAPCWSQRREIGERSWHFKGANRRFDERFHGAEYLDLAVVQLQQEPSAYVLFHQPARCCRVRAKRTRFLRRWNGISHVEPYRNGEAAGCLGPPLRVSNQADSPVHATVGAHGLASMVPAPGAGAA